MWYFLDHEKYETHVCQNGRLCFKVELHKIYFASSDDCFMIATTRICCDINLHEIPVPLVCISLTWVLFPIPYLQKKFVTF